MLRRQLIRQFFSPPSPAPPRPPRGFGTDGSRAVVTNQRRSKHGEEQTHPNGETSVGCKGATEECRSRNANSARHDPIEFQAGNGDCAPESPPGNHGTSDHEGNRLQQHSVRGFFAGSCGKGWACRLSPRNRTESVTTASLPARPPGPEPRMAPASAKWRR
jgi:hypothetical protein